MKPDTKHTLKIKKDKGVAREWGEALVVAFIIAMIIRAFFLQAYRIPSSSMEDTLLVGDHLLATKYNYGTTIPFTTSKLWGDHIVPHRGDVIIFTFPKNHRMDFVKRVIGLPGDIIEVRDKHVLINGKEYLSGHEKYTDPNIITQGPGIRRDNFGPVKVLPGHIFAMGDNRDQSYDCRFWGQVPIKNIKGKVWIIYFSWDSKDHAIRFSRFCRMIH
ncbi:MAG: signal peptidase I [Thermodesulfobacteriota bacterium]|nr:signal peptidase I [Thermodesulfobacteriota bacterium]